jgi:hypothetical protein
MDWVNRSPAAGDNSPLSGDVDRGQQVFRPQTGGFDRLEAIALECEELIVELELLDALHYGALRDIHTSPHEERVIALFAEQDVIVERVDERVADLAVRAELPTRRRRLRCRRRSHCRSTQKINSSALPSFSISPSSVPMIVSLRVRAASGQRVA